MKGLSKFFDTRRFLEGKRLEVVGVSKWNDFETKQQLGTKVNTVIAEDHTVYPTKDGETITNKYASMSVKVRKMDLTVPVGAIIELVNPVGVVYGEFHSQLSVTADDIKVVSTPKV